MLDRTVAAMDIPLGQAGTADEAAQLITFLVSPATIFTNSLKVIIFFFSKTYRRNRRARRSPPDLELPDGAGVVTPETRGTRWGVYGPVSPMFY